MMGVRGRRAVGGVVGARVGVVGVPAGGVGVVGVGGVGAGGRGGGVGGGVVGEHPGPRARVAERQHHC